MRSPSWGNSSSASSRPTSICTCISKLKAVTLTTPLLIEMAFGERGARPPQYLSYLQGTAAAWSCRGCFPASSCVCVRLHLCGPALTGTSRKQRMDWWGRSYDVSSISGYIPHLGFRALLGSRKDPACKWIVVKSSTFVCWGGGILGATLWFSVSFLWRWQANH